MESAELAKDVRRFYSLLDRLTVRTGAVHILELCHGRMDWPLRGVYLFFESGERRGAPNNAQLRVVRVGTHAVSATDGSGTTLWSRLKQHRGTGAPGGGNHRGSIFRQHVGDALINAGRYRGPGISSWADKSANADEIAREDQLEKLVSEHIGRMPFITLAIDDEPSASSMRAYVERNSIALLSRGGELDPPSGKWLGKHSADERIRMSGLWNIRHVGEAYDPGFLDTLERLVDQQRPASYSPHPTQAPPRPSIGVPLARPGVQARYLQPAIALVSCTKKKTSYPCRAAELYRPSTFFQKAYAYAGVVAGDTFILSAKYGLVRPADIIAPYEQTLVNAPRSEIRGWAGRVHAQLRDSPEYQRAKTVVWLAGELYRSELLPLVRGDGKQCIIPMEGLAQGEQLEWLSAQFGGRSGEPGILAQSPPKVGTWVDPPAQGILVMRAAQMSSPTAPRAEDFERELRKLKARARSESKSWIEVNAGQLHRLVGGYPGKNNRMPVCCRVMTREMGSGDMIIKQPPKGHGASLQIRYRLAS